MKKILYITTVGRTINAFLLQHIKKLIIEGNKVDCACSIECELDKINRLNNDMKIYNIPFSRNPLSFNNIRAFKKLKKIQIKNKYDIVHVHTPVASFYGRLLKLKFPNLKIIYTVHGFHFYNGAPIKNWILYYPIERIMSRFTDVLLTMNSEDYKQAKNLKANEVYKVKGVGIDLKQYSPSNFDKEKIENELGIDKDDFVIIMIAEVNKNKNHKQMINAIEILKKEGIDNIKVICAGSGDMFTEVVEYVNDKKLQNNIKMLGFRTDIKELISISHIGILMSYREGLPRNIMELMALGKPIIGTRIRGVKDLVKDNFNGYLVDINDYKTTSKKIKFFYENREKIDYMGKNSLHLISEFNIDKVLKELMEFY